MKIENKFIIVDIDGLSDNHSVCIELPRNGRYLTMSKDEAYELWASLNQIFNA